MSRLAETKPYVPSPKSVTQRELTLTPRQVFHSPSQMNVA
jgi:hypothetical protein